MKEEVESMSDNSAAGLVQVREKIEALDNRMARLEKVVRILAKKFVQQSRSNTEPSASSDAGASVPPDGFPYTMGGREDYSSSCFRESHVSVVDQVFQKSQ
jgi:hypothetical protein